MSLPDPSPSSAALITGASAGIGSCIARELAARGHNVVLVARRKQRLEELATELMAEHGVGAHTISCDLARPASRGRLPGRIGELGLDVEVLINNAGFATNGPFYEADAERELQQVRLDVEAVVALSSAFVPAMVHRRRGAVLNVASTAGMQPLPYSAGLLGGQGIRADVLRGAPPRAQGPRRDSDRARSRPRGDRFLGDLRLAGDRWPVVRAGGARPRVDHAAAGRQGGCRRGSRQAGALSSRIPWCVTHCAPEGTCLTR